MVIDINLQYLHLIHAITRRGEIPDATRGNRSNECGRRKSSSGYPSHFNAVGHESRHGSGHGQNEGALGASWRQYGDF